MSERNDNDFLNDITEAARRTASYTENLSYKEFMEDIKTQDAVIRNLEIIGEAVKNLSEKLRVQYSDIQWKGMAGIRDKLIHHYFGVNFDIVWAVAKNELPDIAEKVERIIQTYSDNTESNG